MESADKDDQPAGAPRIGTDVDDEMEKLANMGGSGSEGRAG
ncbi:MAG: hypothetical protein PHO15_07500 [Eubacteriales bacterium]|nr:hypothetical protein [Eubacteriales bacterium]